MTQEESREARRARLADLANQVRESAEAEEAERSSLASADGDVVSGPTRAEVALAIWRGLAYGSIAALPLAMALGAVADALGLGPHLTAAVRGVAPAKLAATFTGAVAALIALTDVAVKFRARKLEDVRVRVFGPSVEPWFLVILTAILAALAVPFVVHALR